MSDQLEQMRRTMKALRSLPYAWTTFPELKKEAGPPPAHYQQTQRPEDTKRLEAYRDSLEDRVAPIKAALFILILVLLCLFLHL